MQAEPIVRKIPRRTGPLGGRMDTLDPFQQSVDCFRLAFHARRLEHEFGQHLHDVDEERPFLVLRQIVEDILGLNADKERRELRVDHQPAHPRCRVGFSNPPIRHVVPRMRIELV